MAADNMTSQSRNTHCNTQSFSPSSSLNVPCRRTIWINLLFPERGRTNDSRCFNPCPYYKGRFCLQWNSVCVSVCTSDRVWEWKWSVILIGNQIDSLLLVPILLRRLSFLRLRLFGSPRGGDCHDALPRGWTATVTADAEGWSNGYWCSAYD